MGFFNKNGVPEELPSLEPENSENEKKEKTAKLSHETGINYFENLISNIFSELSKEGESDPKKLMPKSFVDDMKNYWKKKHSSIFLDNPGRELRTSLLENIENIQKLEREWREMFFSLSEKEEKIKEAELKLKKDISELIELSKRFKSKSN